jgi:hypothetical protein
VLPVRIQGHDCHVYEYTESALQQLPPDVDYHGYAQRYKAFAGGRIARPSARPGPERPCFGTAVAAGFTAAKFHPSQEAGRESHDG